MKTAAMTALDLKDDMLTMLANTKERATLLLLHRIMVSITKGKPADWWDELSDEQRADLELALEEIKHPENLVSNTEALKMLSQWRSLN